ARLRPDEGGAPRGLSAHLAHPARLRRRAGLSARCDRHLDALRRGHRARCRPVKWLALLAPLAFGGLRAMPLPGADGFCLAGHDAIRGMTIGPIENGYHPGVGYGSAAYGRTLDECAKMGATWVAITPFGRVLDLTGRGVDPTF